jgi:hypothetical protein
MLDDLLLKGKLCPPDRCPPIGLRSGLVVIRDLVRDGSRKVTRITEVQGVEGDNVVLQDIFIFQAVAMRDSSKLEGYEQLTMHNDQF